MKFGLFVMGTRDSSYTDIIDQVVEAEELGFDSVWLAERHFHHGDLLWPAPMVAAAYIAARPGVGLGRTHRPLGRWGRSCELPGPGDIAEHFIRSGDLACMAEADQKIPISATAVARALQNPMDAAVTYRSGAPLRGGGKAGSNKTSL